jgi:predicted deacylase
MSLPSVNPPSVVYSSRVARVKSEKMGRAFPLERSNSATLAVTANCKEVVATFYLERTD